jgi:hypothetical protein
MKANNRTRQYVAFESIDELITAINASDYIHYQAPMDHRPHGVWIAKYTIDNRKPERSSVVIEAGRDYDRFTAKLSEHFPRFRKAVL